MIQQTNKSVPAQFPGLVWFQRTNSHQSMKAVIIRSL